MTERDLHEDREVAAAALALGLLDDAERAAAIQQKFADPAFAARVAFWEAKCEAWLEELAPEEPRPGLLADIEAAIDGLPGATGVPPPANENPPGGNLWRNWAMLATAASLLLAIGLGFAVRGGPAAPPAATENSANVAQISDQQGAALLSALYDPASGSLSLRMSDLAQADKAPELWIIPEDGVPRSLGQIGSQTLTISISPELRAFLVDGATMAITLEPRDGKVHTAPTGKVLGTATLRKLPPI